jgi:hypothetical protein
MPIDIDSFITPSDLKLIEKARRRGGKAAADKLIAKIALRAATTAGVHNQKIERELQDDTDRVWPNIPMMTQKLRAPK